MMPDQWRQCSLCGMAYPPSAIKANGMPFYHDLIERTGRMICRNVLLCLNRRQAGKLSQEEPAIHPDQGRV